MAAPRNRRHLLITAAPEAEGFTTRRLGRGKAIRRPEDRVGHSRALQQAFNQALERPVTRRHATTPATKGVLVSFQGPPGVELKLDSLENRPHGIEVRSVVRPEPATGQPFVESATVFIPERSVGHFLARFQEYGTQNTRTGHPKHRELVDRIAEIHAATFRAFWTDDPRLFPGDGETIWWEVWLRRDESEPGQEVHRFRAFAEEAGVALGARTLVFEDRTVCLVQATVAQLSASVHVLDDLSEVRGARPAHGFFVDQTPAEQAAWADDLLGRLQPPGPGAPAVCVLDTGVTQGHPLLAPALDPVDATAADPQWGALDNGGGAAGHGTEMAGLALYGDLGPVLESDAPVTLRHRLESVKILPPQGQNAPELYGAVTALAISRPEIQAPARRRVFSMAVTGPVTGAAGQPTSWSAAVDALAAGRSFDPVSQGLVYLDEADREAHRLFVVAAGNVGKEQFQMDHLSVSDLSPVQDPAQAWNALTVGACTEKSLIQHADYAGWQPVAAPGDLSPWSSTGLTMGNEWPNKPDVVFEGGNVATDGTEFDPGVPDLCVLTTFHRPLEKPFVSSNATSAATAQVARIAALVSAEYPELWPETVRALVVHSAEWTPVAQAAIDAAGSKQAVGQLVRRYGFGAPSAERAIRSANDALTLVSQSEIRPYQAGKTREMHIHQLPWPVEVLRELDAEEVRLRVTLSYFVEPNPARRGWRARHQYASCGLRFDVKTGDEDVKQFRLRLNKQAASEAGERPTSSSDSAKWLLGDRLRHRGSLHADLWKGTAVELAARGVIGVYPVKGWWQEQPTRDRSEKGVRYALIVSVETRAEGVDVWTPVAQQVGVPVQAVEIDW